MERKKIRRDSLGFHNAFTLPATLPAGDYYLRGYSNWMLNEDPDFFFSRNIKIGNSIDNTIVSSIEYQQEDDTHYTAKIKFTSNVQAVFENTTIKYLYLENGKIKNKGKKKTDENGWISISLPDLKSPAARRIEVEFDDPQYIYKRTFHLPVFTNDFDVKFFPEGGAYSAFPIRMSLSKHREQTVFLKKSKVSCSTPKETRLPISGRNTTVWVSLQ